MSYVNEYYNELKVILGKLDKILIYDLAENIAKVSR